MTMRRWSLAVAVAGAYAGALLALAPASLVDLGLDRATNGRLRLASRPVRCGRVVDSSSCATRAGGAVGRPVEWRLKPGGLRDGGIDFEVRARGSDAPFSVILSWRRFELTAARMSLPARALGLALPQLAPLELTGSVSLDVPAVVWEKGELNGGVALERRGLCLSTIAPLGNYELKFECSRRSRACLPLRGCARIARKRCVTLVSAAVARERAHSTFTSRELAPDRSLGRGARPGLRARVSGLPRFGATSFSAPPLASSDAAARPAGW